MISADQGQGHLEFYLFEVTLVSCIDSKNSVVLWDYDIELRYVITTHAQVRRLPAQVGGGILSRDGIRTLLGGGPSLPCSHRKALA